MTPHTSAYADFMHYREQILQELRALEVLGDDEKRIRLLSHLEEVEANISRARAVAHEVAV